MPKPVPYKHRLYISDLFAPFRQRAIFELPPHCLIQARVKHAQAVAVGVVCELDIIVGRGIFDFLEPPPIVIFIFRALIFRVHLRRIGGSIEE